MGSKNNSQKDRVDLVGLPPGSISKLRPIVSGNFDVFWRVEDFQPYVIKGVIHRHRFSKDSWKKIEDAVGSKIDPRHREWIEFACASFIFATLHRGKIPSARQYHKQLVESARVLGLQVKALLAAFLFRNDEFDTHIAGKLTTAPEHIAAYGIKYWKEELASLAQLGKNLDDFRQSVKQESPKTDKGREANYELHYFFHTLFLVAQSLGLSSSIPSRRTRERKEAKRTTQFDSLARSVLNELLAYESKILSVYNAASEPSDASRRLFHFYVNKPNIIDDLMEARRRALGGVPLPKKWAKKST